MKCKDYVFELTSGRLQESAWHLQASARLHILMCRHCRAFTQNDQALLDATRSHREQLVRDFGQRDGE